MSIASQPKAAQQSGIVGPNPPRVERPLFPKHLAEGFKPSLGLGLFT